MPKAESEPLEVILRRLEASYADDQKIALADADEVRKPQADNAGESDDITEASMLPLLAAICIIPRNEPNDYSRLWAYFATESVNSYDLPRLVLRLRTALFKAVPLVGVPRIINALAALHDAVKTHPNAEHILEHLPTQSSKPSRTTEQDSAAGWAFFKAIYGKHAESIIERIGKSSPDLAEMIVDELYGANLSRTEVLSWRETVVVEFVGW